MSHLYKLQKNSGWRQKRIRQTEPIEVAVNGEDSKVIEAKLYLLNLTREPDEWGNPSRDETLCSLSQWNSQKLSHQKVDSRQKYNVSQKKRHSRISPKRTNLELLSTFQKQLIDTINQQSVSERPRCDPIFIGKKHSSRRARINTMNQSSLQPLNLITASFSQQRPPSILIHQEEVSKHQRAHKIDLCAERSVMEDGAPRGWPSRQGPDKLPRLERMLPQHHRRNYKSIFRHHADIKYSVPMQSSIGREIHRIYDLIQEENIRLMRQAYRK